MNSEINQIENNKRFSVRDLHINLPSIQIKKRISMQDFVTQSLPNTILQKHQLQKYKTKYADQQILMNKHQLVNLDAFCRQNINKKNSSEKIICPLLHRNNHNRKNIKQFISIEPPDDGTKRFYIQTISLRENEFQFKQKTNKIQKNTIQHKRSLPSLNYALNCKLESNKNEFAQQFSTKKLNLQRLNKKLKINDFQIDLLLQQKGQNKRKENDRYKIDGWAVMNEEGQES